MSCQSEVWFNLFFIFYFKNRGCMAQSCSNLSRASWISSVRHEPGRVDYWVMEPGSSLYGSHKSAVAAAESWPGQNSQQMIRNRRAQRKRLQLVKYLLPRTPQTNKQTKPPIGWRWIFLTACTVWIKRWNCVEIILNQPFVGDSASWLDIMMCGLAAMMTEQQEMNRMCFLDKHIAKKTNPQTFVSTDAPWGSFLKLQREWLQGSR